MDRQELFIDNNIVELSDDVAVALNFLIADIAEPENQQSRLLQDNQFTGQRED